MEIGFTNQEAMFIHGRFKLELEELKIMKAAPDCPIDDESIYQQMSIVADIVEKLEDAIPNLAKMNPYLERIAQKRSIKP